MKSFFSYAFLAFLVVLSFSSCEEEENICEDCQSAIDHMFHKIEQNNCNPDLMGDAVSRMREDCGQFPAEAYAGLMAHSCANNDFTGRPLCDSNDDGVLYDYLALTDVQVEIEVISLRDSDESVMVDVLNGSGGTSNEANYQMFPDDHVDHFINRIGNGSELDFVIRNIETDEVMLQKTVVHRFWRAGYWEQMRQVQIQYIPLLDEYDVVFNYW